MHDVHEKGTGAWEEKPTTTTVNVLTHKSELFFTHIYANRSNGM